MPLNNAMLMPHHADYIPKVKKMNKKSSARKIFTLLVLFAVVLATITMTYAAGHQKVSLTAIDAGATIVPTGVTNSLNITFSGVTYSTVAPAFEFSRGNYNGNAAWTGSSTKGAVNVTNSTYLVMQQNSTTAGSSQVQYNLTKFTGRSYMFMEAKLAANLTNLVGISIVLSDKGVASYLASAKGTGVAAGTVVINVASTGDLTASANESSTQTSTGTNSGKTTLKALQFYDITVYAYQNKTNENVAVALIDPANGAVLGTSLMNGITGVNFTKLNYTAFQFDGGAAFGSALILDWGYFTFSGTSALATSSAEASPFIVGSAPDVSQSFTVAPFDPAAANNTTYKQAPNASAVNVNTKVGINDFGNQTILSNETSALLSEGAYNISGKTNFGVGKNDTANSTAMVANLTLNKENTNSFTADIHVSTFNASGISSAVMSFLKNYTANLATVNTGVSYTYKNMTIISYMVSNIQTITTLSAADASAVRDYFDNAFPAILSANNLSLVNTNTSTIVAGAFAGDFYYQGMAVVPQAEPNGMILNPLSGQEYANLSDAGFSAGAYISGGVVVVPQLQITGYYMGTPIFASGSVITSIFGGLTSAGSAVESYLGNGLSDITNEIGTVSKTATDYVVKPIESAASSTAATISNDISSFKTQVGNLESSIIPAIGAVTNNVEGSIKGALGPISGAVSDLSSSLASAKNGIVSAVAAGASGLKSDIYTLGTQVSQGTQGIINTLGARISQTDAVLSSMFTELKTLPGTISTDVQSVAAGLKTSVLSSLDSVGNTITSTVKGGLNSVSNAYAAISSKITGTLGTLKNGVSSAFSFIASFGAKLGYVLEIVGITIAVVAIVGIVLYIYFRKSPAGEVIEGSSKLLPSAIPAF